jgi:hypothetical protein
MWKNEEINGEGTFHYKNGDIYKGSFINGSRNGKGNMHYQNGNVYFGNFVNDIREGSNCKLVILPVNDFFIYIYIIIKKNLIQLHLLNILE